MASSVCIPCDLPYVNSVWMPRRRSDRPRVVPEGATNLGFLGQFAEVPQEVAFTIEYPPARRGKRSTACYGAVLRHRPFIRASTIQRRCSPR